ncbi:MAG: hypothetical protein AAF613_02595 [Pseudomonadota bacterium]
MNTKHVLAAFAAAITLGACTTATPYQAANGNQRGYVDQQIEDDRWRVSFSGNSLTDRQTVETYLLYRAAELTDMMGFDHFSVVKQATDADRQLRATGFTYDPYYAHFPFHYRFYGHGGRLYRPYRSAAYGFHGPYHYADPFWHNRVDYREIVRYEASAEIVMGRGEKPDDPAYYSASQVILNLSGQIQRPEA